MGTENIGRDIWASLFSAGGFPVVGVISMSIPAVLSAPWQAYCGFLWQW
jgi:hypothetical protein